MNIKSESNTIQKYLDQSIVCMLELRKLTESLITSYKIIDELRKSNNTVFVCGNGGSASTASHFVNDLVKIGQVNAICLSDNVPLCSAIANDIGWSDIYIYQLEQLYKSGDVLVVISNSGGSNKGNIPEHSQNLIKAVEYVNKKDGWTIGLSGGDGGEFNKCKDNIIVASNDVLIIEPIHSTICHIVPLLMREDK